MIVSGLCLTRGCANAALVRCVASGRSLTSQDAAPIHSWSLSFRVLDGDIASSPKLRSSYRLPCDVAEELLERMLATSERAEIVTKKGRAMPVPVPVAAALGPSMASSRPPTGAEMGWAVVSFPPSSRRCASASASVLQRAWLGLAGDRRVSRAFDGRRSTMVRVEVMSSPERTRPRFAQLRRARTIVTGDQQRLDYADDGECIVVLQTVEMVRARCSVSPHRRESVRRPKSGLGQAFWVRSEIDTAVRRELPREKASRTAQTHCSSLSNPFPTSLFWLTMASLRFRTSGGERSRCLELCG